MSNIRQLKGRPGTFLEELAREVFDEFYDEYPVAYCWMVFRTKAMAAQQDMREARVAFDAAAAAEAEIEECFAFEDVHGRGPLSNDELQQWIRSPEGQAAIKGDLDPYDGEGA